MVRLAILRAFKRDIFFHITSISTTTVFFLVYIKSFLVPCCLNRNGNMDWLESLMNVYLSRQTNMRSKEANQKMQTWLRRFTTEFVSPHLPFCPLNRRGRRWFTHTHPPMITWLGRLLTLIRTLDPQLKPRNKPIHRPTRVRYSSDMNQWLLQYFVLVEKTTHMKRKQGPTFCCNRWPDWGWCHVMMVQMEEWPCFGLWRQRQANRKTGTHTHYFSYFDS